MELSLIRPNVIGVIPARGRSKAVPKKNNRELGGFLIIAYSVVARQLTKNIGRSIVSKDSREIANVSSRYNAGIPFLRPAEFARDELKDIEFISLLPYLLMDMQKLLSARCLRAFTSNW